MKESLKDLRIVAATLLDPPLVKVMWILARKLRFHETFVSFIIFLH